MEYRIAHRGGKEQLQLFCPACEDCYRNKDAVDMMWRIESLCGECCECIDKHTCSTMLHEGELGSLLLSFLSLDFDVIRETCNNYLKTDIDNADYFDGGKKGHYTGPMEVVAGLSALHPLFVLLNEDSFESIGQKVAQGQISFSTQAKFSWELKQYSYMQQLLHEISGHRLVKQEIDDIHYLAQLLNIATARESVPNIVDWDSHKEQADQLRENGASFLEISQAISAGKQSANSADEIYFLPDNLYGLVAMLLYQFIESGAVVQRCEHCHNFFTPKSRIDTKYCSNASPLYPQMTCGEAEKYVRQMRRMKDDEFNKKYKVAYNTIRNRLNSKKAIEDETTYSFYKNYLNDFLKENQINREKLSSGKMTAEEYLSWLNQAKQKKV